MAHINFSWTAPTTLADGTALSDKITYNLYENGTKIVPDIAATNFSLLMDGKVAGVYTYTVTTTDSATTLESVQSVPVKVSFVSPQSPTGLSYTFSAS